MCTDAFGITQAHYPQRSHNTPRFETRDHDRSRSVSDQRFDNELRRDLTRARKEQAAEMILDHDRQTYRRAQRVADQRLRNQLRKERYASRHDGTTYCNTRERASSKRTTFDPLGTVIRAEAKGKNIGRSLLEDWGNSRPQTTVRTRESCSTRTRYAQTFGRQRSVDYDPVRSIVGLFNGQR